MIPWEWRMRLVSWRIQQFDKKRAFAENQFWKRREWFCLEKVSVWRYFVATFWLLRRERFARKAYATYMAFYKDPAKRPMLTCKEPVGPLWP